jgi:hypothetical protein
MFNKQLKELKIPVNTYLKIAKQRAKNAGYNPRLLTISKDPTYKLNYDGVNFGRTGYGDYIIWSILEERGRVEPGYAEQKRNVFQKSHSQIKGDWRNNPKSPNNLALKINW